MEEFLAELKEDIYPKSNVFGGPTGRIMGYRGICDCDDEYMCEHRADYVLNKVRDYLMLTRYRSEPEY